MVREKNGDRILAVVRENTTKTSCSRRNLPLCQYTYQYFWNLRQKQLAQMSLCGTSYDPRYTDLVCVDDLGTLLQPDYVSQKFQKVLEKYQLRRIRFHDLRHPYVKHTTKKFNSEKQKTQATKIMDLIAWGFCFCIVSYSKRSWTL